MKLYLSSYRLGNHPEKLIKLISGNKKIAVIANAMDFLDGFERDKYVKQEINDLAKLGLIAEDLDLRNYFNRQNKLKDKLDTYNAVWVGGGNVFILRRAMSQSGLNKLLKEKKHAPDFVYAGYSAGVCVLSPSLRGLELVDNPNRIPERYLPQIIWEGLDIIDFSFAPHYRSDHPESKAVDEEVEYFIKHKITFKTLRDGEVIIIDSNKHNSNI